MQESQGRARSHCGGHYAGTNRGGGTLEPFVSGGGIRCTRAGRGPSWRAAAAAAAAVVVVPGTTTTTRRPPLQESADGRRDGATRDARCEMRDAMRGGVSHMTVGATAGRASPAGAGSAACRRPRALAGLCRRRRAHMERASQTARSLASAGAGAAPVDDGRPSTPRPRPFHHAVPRRRPARRLRVAAVGSGARVACVAWPGLAGPRDATATATATGRSGLLVAIRPAGAVHAHRRGGGGGRGGAPYGVYGTARCGIKSQEVSHNPNSAGPLPPPAARRPAARPVWNGSRRAAPGRDTVLPYARTRDHGRARPTVTMSVPLHSRLPRGPTRRPPRYQTLGNTENTMVRRLHARRGGPPARHWLRRHVRRTDTGGPPVTQWIVADTSRARAGGAWRGVAWRGGGPALDGRAGRPSAHVEKESWDATPAAVPADSRAGRARARVCGAGRGRRGPGGRRATGEAGRWKEGGDGRLARPGQARPGQATAGLGRRRRHVQVSCVRKSSTVRTAWGDCAGTAPEPPAPRRLHARASASASARARASASTSTSSLHGSLHHRRRRRHRRTRCTLTVPPASPVTPVAAGTASPAQPSPAQPSPGFARRRQACPAGRWSCTCLPTPAVTRPSLPTDRPPRRRADWSARRKARRRNQTDHATADLLPDEGGGGRAGAASEIEKNDGNRSRTSTVTSRDERTSVRCRSQDGTGCGSRGDRLAGVAGHGSATTYGAAAFRDSRRLGLHRVLKVLPSGATAERLVLAYAIVALSRSEASMWEGQPSRDEGERAGPKNGKQRSANSPSSKAWTRGLRVRRPAYHVPIMPCPCRAWPSSDTKTPTVGSNRPCWSRVGYDDKIVNSTSPHHLSPRRRTAKAPDDLEGGARAAQTGFRLVRGPRARTAIGQDGRT